MLEHIIYGYWDQKRVAQELNDIVYIINKVDVLVTNDSGPMHIGAATGTPLEI